MRIEAGAIVEFATYMTGELFSVISQHCILSHAVALSGQSTANSQPFREGVATAMAAPSGLTASLFRLRAAQLLGFEQRGDGTDRLSGLLIGTEIGGFDRSIWTATNVGGCCGPGHLGQLYEIALRERGSNDSRLIDAEEAPRRGLSKAAINIWGAKV